MIVDAEQVKLMRRFVTLEWRATRTLLIRAIPSALFWIGLIWLLK